MKPAVIVILMLILGILFLRNASEEGLGEDLSDQASLPFKYASLLAAEPETKIQIPLRTIGRSEISDTWGAPRGSDRKHHGQDLFAPKGTKIYSATGGYVWRVGESDLGGNTVWVIGAGGRVYYYAHLDRYAEGLKVGDEVTTETVLGYVGNSGNAKGTPPHLHFGVYTRSGAVDPLDLF